MLNLNELMIRGHDNDEPLYDYLMQSLGALHG